MRRDVLYVFTDGASSGNPGPGGYGVVLKFNEHYKELSQGYRMTTNNRMELLAAIKGLEAIKIENQKVILVSDSKYVIDAFEKDWVSGWIKKDFKNVKNPDLWKILIPLVQKHKVDFEWVKGHNGHPENERCDELAVNASKNPKMIDVFFEKGIN